ncbi:Serine carboxypeptidase-like 18 [Sesamum angolense]|uniref:Carboxypeptidase n=1 Tax=Sesamum angolense TaxID=2727404 RepID=A0AAE1VYZ1_9LAMI|nr:Serine carboxypeptidase-like 18 [Sesamum angolense]
MEFLSLKLLLFPLVILCSSRAVLPQHLVETLPGLPDKLPNKLETGYIGVGENEEAQLFYYFLESESNPEEDPFILWFTGGPGCTGLSTILVEMGTFVLDYANCKGGPVALKLNEYAWTKWLIDHPKYLENPLYIFGESYAGIIVPLVVNEVYDGIEVGDKPVLNMKSAKVNCHGNYQNIDSDNDLCLNDLERINQVSTENSYWLS